MDRKPLVSGQKSKSGECESPTNSGITPGMLEALYGISYDSPRVRYRRFVCAVHGGCCQVLKVTGLSREFAAAQRLVLFGLGIVAQLVPEAVRGQVNHRKQLRWRWHRSFPGRLELAGLELVSWGPACVVT